ncbi:MAG TPA: NUDIX domain-containing protein [Xanthobacteraceae bacterium]|jgi:predicted NUDIX family NTP pyrophosphohydrolase|nr:NUDIX domain-containing protein [Xanthobacteraceae bacterium]
MPRERQISAGILAFRRRRELEILLAHPGGPFWVKKDAGAWTIPKGLVEPDDDLVAAARREFTEETNLVAAGDLIALTPVLQKSGKLVHAFALEAEFDLSQFASNAFELEWPPKSGRRQSFPEIDRIAYFSLPTAKQKIIAYQLPLLRELEKRLQAPRA